MSKRKLIDMSAEEFIKRLDSGERDFRYIKLYGPKVDILGKSNERGKINLEQFKDIFLHQFGSKPWEAPLLLKGSVFRDVNLDEAWLDYMQAEGTDFSGSDICRAHMSNAYLVKAILNGTYLVDTEMNRTNFRDAEMKNVNIYYSAIAFSNFKRADLSNADAFNADMREVDLRNANLENANFRGSNLRKAKLTNANLKKANFNDCNLSEAELTGAYNLENVEILGANCYKTQVTDDQRAILLPKMQLGKYMITK